MDRFASAVSRHIKLKGTPKLVWQEFVNAVKNQKQIARSVYFEKDDNYDSTYYDSMSSYHSCICR